MRLFLFAFAGGMGGFSHFFLAQAFGFSSFEYAELREAYEKRKNSKGWSNKKKTEKHPPSISNKYHLSYIIAHNPLLCYIHKSQSLS